MKKIFNILLMLFVVMGFTACGDDLSNSAEGLDTNFAVSKSEVTFAKSGGTIDLYVRAGQQPSVSSDADWAVVEAAESESSITYKYTLTVAENTGYDDRTATLTVAVGSETKTVTVNQTATSGLILETSSFDVSADGDTITVKLKSNGTYTYTPDVSWITEPTTRATMQEYSHTFVVAPNYVGESREGTITFTQDSLVEAVTVTQEANGDASITASAMDIAPEMYPGWNLGNTLEASFSTDDDLSAETSWQSTKTSQAIIDYVKSLGFKSVRIPCSWYIHFNSGTTTINSEWMARVKEVVDYCIQDGLYVILNDHYDGGWVESSFGSTDDATVEAKCDTMKALWTQVANEFKNYDKHLIFAGMNEPNQDQQTDMTDAQTTALVKYEQAFIDAVRATGGNNANRILVIQGPKADISTTISQLPVSKFPTDTQSGKLMLEVHYYTPWQFCGLTEDADWGKMQYFWGAANHVDGSDRNADSQYEESYIQSLFAQLKTNYYDQGYPIILGEYGALWRDLGNTSNQANHNASIQLFHQTVNEQAVDNGIVPFVWDTNSLSLPSMTIVNRAGLNIFNQYALDGILAGVQNATWAE
jgi:endoglucanase